MNNWFLKACRETKSLFLFIAMMFIFRSAVADWNEVPTGSMKPTILEGDRIFVNKMAYDLRVPFTHISLFKISDPEPGDIVIFDSEVSDKRLVKRVIGVPGDIVALKNNELIINGKPIGYTSLSSSPTSITRVESLTDAQHLIQVNKQRSVQSSFDSVVVPADYYLVLGDNRDHSADSRMIGFVPREEIVGKSSHVVLSLNYENYYIPRKDRFLHKL